MTEKRKLIRRRFLGSLDMKHLDDGKTVDREAMNLQKKHLRAYLRGQAFFMYKGQMHKVQQEYYQV